MCNNFLKDFRMLDNLIYNMTSLCDTKGTSDDLKQFPIRKGYQYIGIILKEDENFIVLKNAGFSYKVQLRKKDFTTPSIHSNQSYPFKLIQNIKNNS